MAVSLNGDGTITGLSTLSSVTITGLTSLTTTDLTADTTTLVVDSANNRVGIGTASPSTTLQVVGTATATAFSGPLTGNVTGDVSGNAGTVTNGVYTTDIGSTVQAYDADLTTIGGLAKTDGNFIVGNGTTWVAESGATARTSLGLGSLATLSEVNGATIADNSVSADELNVSGNGTSGQYLASDGDGSMTWTTLAAGGGFSNMQVFTSSGTWTNPGTVTRVKVTVIGGGGGGGIARWPFDFFSGGAGGGTAIETLTIPTAPVSITVGGGGAGMVFPIPTAANFAASGGTSSFGAFCSATGGAGGLGTAATTASPAPSFYYRANAGVGTGATININGEPTITIDHVPSGAASLGGRVSWFNYPGSGPTAPQTPAVWADAVVYGAGGGCTSSPGPSPIWRAGNGKSGVVIVEY